MQMMQFNTTVDTINKSAFYVFQSQFIQPKHVLNEDKTKMLFYVKIIYNICHNIIHNTIYIYIF